MLRVRVSGAPWTLASVVWAIVGRSVSTVLRCHPARGCSSGRATGSFRQFRSPAFLILSFPPLQHGKQVPNPFFDLLATQMNSGSVPGRAACASLQPNQMLVGGGAANQRSLIDKFDLHNVVRSAFTCLKCPVYICNSDQNLGIADWFLHARPHRRISTLHRSQACSTDTRSCPAVSHTSSPNYIRESCRRRQKVLQLWVGLMPRALTAASRICSDPAISVRRILKHMSTARCGEPRKAALSRHS